MKNITNTLTKLLAVVIFSVSLNAFSLIPLAPFITISANHVSATVGTAITPVTVTNTGAAASYYSIAPAISNGLSFDAKTGTISGAPIVASDVVTYTVTAVLMTYTMSEVDRHAQDTVTVVIAVGAGTTNLALGKPATQSSTYLYHSIVPVAGYAVDGNTDGYFLNKSTTHTHYEQGAWWQVDLGGEKNIKQIIIYNRTDCCVNRLSNYQVSISNKADFSTHTYQQDFHVAPNPKKIIQLDASGKQGRYVRIQLLDSDYLSLAEVQVMGVDLLRFSEVDYSSSQNDFDGFNNSPNYANKRGFAAIKDDGSIMMWTDPNYGGIPAPSGSGYTKIYSNGYAFATLEADGSITAWGGTNNEGTGAPSDSGYTKIYSTQYAFAALKADGSITAWGYSYWGGTTGAPSDNGYTKIYSNAYAFAALKADGSITTWGDIKSGGTNSPNAPTDKGYIKIYSSDSAFAALKADGSITSWGNFDSSWGNFESKHINAAPTDKGYTEIYSNAFAFSAVKPDGSIRAWGDLGYGGAYVSGHNLALGKPATQSSTYRYSDPVAGYAVDGNTDGEFLNKSTSTTEYEQGAWWQVDLGSKKNIKQIIIYNRTDCCADRLSNYQVSISDKADFSTHTYQQDFHVAPDPKKIIQLGISGKRGRYVRVQLLDKNYLSLAEVQVIGVDL